MNFKLEDGKFLVGECTKCKKIIWPPSEFCSKCFGKVKSRYSAEHGTIIEFSSKEGRFFCIAEFEKDVKIMGHLQTKKPPQIGQKIKLDKCEIIDGDYNFEMSFLED